MGTGTLRRYHQIHNRLPKPAEEPAPQAIDPAGVAATAKVLNEFKPKPEGAKPRVPSLSKEKQPKLEE